VLKRILGPKRDEVPGERKKLHILNSEKPPDKYKLLTRFLALLRPHVLTSCTEDMRSYLSFLKLPRAAG
jgi:hypothetical protein